MRSIIQIFFGERPESTLPYLVITPILPPHQLPIASCHRDMKFDSTLNVPSSSMYLQSVISTYMPVPCVEHPTHWNLLNFLFHRTHGARIHARMHVHYVRYARM